ncbi:hypothetical protein HKX48_003212 [Thoreauomyces humboldtii]|nr:hypothetical protein HKX48_003212 [Thoreauomyces humboldtii]
MGLSFDRKTALWALLYAYLFTLAGIFTGGIKDQAQYGPDDVCLLFVAEEENAADQKVFESVSPACGITIGVGSLGLLLSALLCGFAMYFLLTNQPRAKRVIQSFALVGTLFTLVMLVGASLASAGLHKTCEALETASPDTSSCAAIFTRGFYSVQADKQVPEGKKLSTVDAAVTVGWLSVLSWGAYSAFEWYQWRVASQRWW